MVLAWQESSETGDVGLSSFGEKVIDQVNFDEGRLSLLLFCDAKRRKFSSKLAVHVMI